MEMSGKMNRYVGGAAACLRGGTDAILVDGELSGLEFSKASLSGS